VIDSKCPVEVTATDGAPWCVWTHAAASLGEASVPTGSDRPAKTTPTTRATAAKQPAPIHTRRRVRLIGRRSTGSGLELPNPPTARLSGRPGDKTTDPYA
jgi:hypothetical protein